jgi:hypothetical protein
MTSRRLVLTAPTPKRATNRKELSIKLAPTATGSVEVTFVETTVSKETGKNKKTRTAESASDTFATVSAAIEAVNLRIGTYIENVKKFDTYMAPLIVMESSPSKPKKEN